MNSRQPPQHSAQFAPRSGSPTSRPLNTPTPPRPGVGRLGSGTNQAHPRWAVAAGEARDESESLQHTFPSEILKGTLHIKLVTPSNSGSTSRFLSLQTLESVKMQGPVSSPAASSLKKRLHFPKGSAPPGSQGTIGNAVPIRRQGAGFRDRAVHAWKSVPGSKGANRKETGRKVAVPLSLRWPERSAEGGAVELIVSGAHSRDVFQEGRG